MGNDAIIASAGGGGRKVKVETVSVELDSKRKNSLRVEKVVLHEGEDDGMRPRTVLK